MSKGLDNSADRGIDRRAVNERVLTLAVEASNPSAASEGSGPGVAIGRVAKDARLGKPCPRVEVLGVEMLRSERRHDDDLMPAIDRLWARLASEGLVGEKAEIEQVAVSVGPGGYTGLRVAVVAGKLIAEAVGAECVGVPSACVVARRASGNLPRPFGVALASKHETSVVTVFGDVEPLSELMRERGREVDVEGIEALGLRGLVADRYLPISIRERCAALGVRIDEPVFDATACLEASAGFEAVNPESLAPIYGREPEAVRKWRELHG